MKASTSMGAGRPRVRASRGTTRIGITRIKGIAAGCVAVAGLAAVVSGCGTASAASPAAAGQASPSPAPATPTVAPSTVPVLGKLAFGTFPSTWDGTRALALCEQWSGLRGQYVTLVGTRTPFQLEQWFSSTAWRPAFIANSPLRTDPAYSDIDTAFGLVSTAAAASVDNARFLDRACAAAD
jgi:hypothetical protein